MRRLVPETTYISHHYSINPQRCSLSWAEPGNSWCEKALLDGTEMTFEETTGHVFTEAGFTVRAALAAC